MDPPELVLVMVMVEELEKGKLFKKEVTFHFHFKVILYFSGPKFGNSGGSRFRASRHNPYFQTFPVI